MQTLATIASLELIGCPDIGGLALAVRNHGIVVAIHFFRLQFHKSIKSVSHQVVLIKIVELNSREAVGCAGDIDHPTMKGWC